MQRDPQDLAARIGATEAEGIQATFSEERLETRRRAKENGLPGYGYAMLGLPADDATLIGTQVTALHRERAGQTCIVDVCLGFQNSNHRRTAAMAALSRAHNCRLFLLRQGVR